MTASQDARGAPKAIEVVPAYHPGFLLGYDPFLENVVPGIEEDALALDAERAPIARGPVADRDDG